MKLIVAAQIAKVRLDKYLSENTDYSRSTLAKMLEQELIFVNGEIAKNSYKVKENDEIEIIGELETLMEDIEPVEMDLDIVYEDEYLMIINKPSGLTVHPGSGNYNNTLVNGLLYYTKNLSNLNTEVNSGTVRPGIVHRLDKDTSGLMVIAKTNEAHEKLSLMFQNKTIERIYIALIEGVFPHKSAVIDAPIGRDKNNRQKQAIVNTGKSAITNLYVKERFFAHTLVELKLETGRTHQIRVHLDYIGYPVVNDPVYGRKIKTATEFGQMLHSCHIKFNHPITNELLEFSSDVPNEFQEKLNDLKQ